MRRYSLDESCANLQQKKERNERRPTKSRVARSKMSASYWFVMLRRIPIVAGIASLDRDCNGQCHPGETLLFRSSWGGSPTEGGGNTKKCARGAKIFRCDAGGWKRITELCYWKKSGVDSSNGEGLYTLTVSSVATIVRAILSKHLIGVSVAISGRPSGDGIMRYRCQKPAVMTECAWPIPQFSWYISWS